MFPNKETDASSTSDRAQRSLSKELHVRIVIPRKNLQRRSDLDFDFVSLKHRRERLRS